MINLRLLTHRLIMIVTATSTAVGFTSCQDVVLDSLEMRSGSTATPVEVTFDLNVGTSRSSSSIAESASTDVDIEDVEGTYAENFVNTDKICVYFLDTSNYQSYGGYYRSTLTIKSAIRIDATTYRVVGTLASLPTTSEFRVAVTANWSYTPMLDQGIFRMCAAKGGEYQYHYGPDKYPENGIYTPSEETPIPMFGVKKYTRSDFAEDPTTVDLGTIYLIRAMVKLIVKPDESTDEIDSVTLATSYNVGLCGPCSIYNDSQTEVVYGSTISNNAIANNVPTRNTSSYGTGYDGLNPLGYTTNLPFKKLDDGRFLLYIPAFDNNYTSNKDSSGNPINYITVEYNGNKYKIEFMDDGVIYDLYRNNMYVYTVKFSHSTFNYTVVKMVDYVADDITFE